jgi:hypothetical protein
MDAPEPRTRRSALRAIAALPILVAGAIPVLARAQSIASLKAQYHWQKFSQHRPQRCMNCAHYTRETRLKGTCSVLQTEVYWENWCTAWSPKQG